MIHTIDLEFQGVPNLIASYLVETGEGLVVVEPGPESTRATHLRKISELGFEAGDVNAVFITHAHLDHCGAGGWWAGQGATLYVHPKAAKHLIDPSRLVDSARGVFGDRFDSLWGETLPAPADKVQVLADAETVGIGGVEFEAIDTPGHAFHHHAFAIGGTVFAGDVAGMRVPGCDYISVTSAPPQFHLESYLNSIDRLCERGVDRLLLTHFGDVSDIGDHLSRYRAAVIDCAEFVRPMVEGRLGAEVIREAFSSYQREASGVSAAQWELYQRGNATDMCADGLRMYWERELAG